MELDMATSEEFMASPDQSQVAKGKRTKRPRTTCSASSPAITTSTTSSSSGLELFADDDRSYEIATTEEEEDMANCLILLAQGGMRTTSSNGVKNNIVENGNSSKVQDMALASSSYECKTCNKSFHSFQALGGHRASHKKPKLSSNEIIEESQLFNKTNNNSIFSNTNSTPTINKSALPSSSSTSKVHECSICGSEFSSGQALGGHMRRHRAAPVILSKPRSILSLDLNLPAPEDDDHFYGESKFHQFATNQKRPFVFSAPALVDCYY